MSIQQHKKGSLLRLDGPELSNHPTAPRRMAGNGRNKVPPRYAHYVDMDSEWNYEMERRKQWSCSTTELDY
jgi:hypothetical protein